MVILKAVIVALITAAVAVALIPLMVLLDLRSGGSGWGLCTDGIGECRNSYFAGFELVGWIFLAMFLLLGMIALCVRILRHLERRAADGTSVIAQ